jgi:phytoene dehydrogenase-like protein
VTRRAFVIGSGPNGLSAAITLARAGVKVTVLEAQRTYGGGLRSEALTLPGFVHDVCSAVHPLALTSPFFRSLPLAEHGLEWVHPTSPLAHPLDGGRCVLVDVNVRDTAARLGCDEAIYRRVVTPFLSNWYELAEDVLAPPTLPKHWGPASRFGLFAPWPASVTVRTLFRNPDTRALFGGMAGHSCLPMETPGSGAFGWILLLAAHAVGWPIACGGSQRIADALVSYLRSLGGELETGRRADSLDELDRDALVMCDVTPRQLLRMGANRLPDRYLRQLESYRYGPGVFKMDWALNAPIPWSDPLCARAGTVHLGGSFEEIAESERSPGGSRPFVLLAQQTMFDRTRAPEGMHTAWAYCHVPNGSNEDMSARIEAQVERFAPGFQSCILARCATGPAGKEAGNENLVGGDINGGACDIRQILARPTLSMYRTHAKGIYICSSSTPPGGGVHGMCGYHAARWALADAIAPE